MELLVNDLSLYGQFTNMNSFRDAVQRVMRIRQTAKRFGRELHCHRNMVNAAVTPAMVMPQAVQALTHDERRAFMLWLTQYGPFWEDAREHQPDDWIEWNGNIVTDKALGEAAWCCLNGIERGLVSFIPSYWQISPITVDWKFENGETKKADIKNFWNSAAVEAFFQTAPTPLTSWSQLEKVAIAQHPRLTFSINAFAPLNGHPFVSCAGQRLLFILGILHQLKSCFDSDGQRTPDGHEIYRNFFTGSKENGGRGALFSDSSDSEKKEFNKELSFKHPEDTNRNLLCTWHGKVQTPQLRVHFSWPIRADTPLYVVYIGPKITKR